MNMKKITLFFAALALISLSACNLPGSASRSSNAGAPTDTQVDLSKAVAATLTAMVSESPANITSTPTRKLAKKPATHTPTLTTPTLTSTPTSTLTIKPTKKPPTDTATLPPTPTPTLTSVPSTLTATTGLLHVIVPITHLKKPVHLIVPPAPQHLDYTASSNYGEANLSAGFAPDPYTVGMTISGDADVSYLGNACSGFTTVAPDLRVNFGGGGVSLLRFYFIASNGDTKIIVNDPYGNYYCVDDSFGTVNPTIDFNNPTGGTYDIWVGGSTSGTAFSGTLYITEGSGNHP